MAFVCRAAIVAAAIGVGLSWPALAQDTAAQAKAEIQRVRDSAGFKAAVQHIDQGYDGYIAEGIKLVEIPAPPFKEEARAKAFAELLRGAGLSEVESGTLTTSANYADFDDFWEPFTFAVGPAGSYLRQQDADRQQAIRDQCFALLGEPSGPFELEARAWYARGTRP